VIAAVGFVGAGQLGEPMVKRLLSAGHAVHVYARRTEVRDRLRGYGASLVDCAGELADRTDIVISCVFSDSQLHEIAYGPDGLVAHAGPETILVSHTTGGVATLTDLAAASRLTVVDAPVSGTAQDIAAGVLTVMIGGTQGALNRIRPVLAAYASPIVETGGLGTALHLKLVNNLIFAANLDILSAATDLGKQLGIEPARLLDALAVCSGGSNVASHARTAGGVEVLMTGAGSYLRKDVEACVKAVDQAGADLGHLAVVLNGGPLAMGGLA
jgi:3-hydroxyisobutyrate dehydrogenase-like beta-hydroxyacid dehydrogenase